VGLHQMFIPAYAGMNRAAPKSDPSRSRPRSSLTLRLDRKIVGAVLTRPVVAVVIPVSVVVVVVPVAQRHVGMAGFISIRLMRVARGVGIPVVAWIAVVPVVTAVVGRAGDRRARYRTNAKADRGRMTSMACLSSDAAATASAPVSAIAVAYFAIVFMWPPFKCRL
jgi:hypothetical protein